VTRSITSVSVWLGSWSTSVNSSIYPFCTVCVAAKWVSLVNVFTPTGGGLLAATERLFQRVIWSADNQCTLFASMRSNAVWCIRPSRLTRSLNQMCSCELRWNWTSTQFGVYFRETTVLIEASVHVGTFSGVATDKLRGQLIPLSVYRRKMQWLSATAESRPKVRSWPSAETKRLPKQYTSLLSAPKPNFGRSLLSCTSRLGPQGPI